MRIQIILAAACLAMVTTGAAAQPARQIDCAGGRAVIRGDRQIVTVSGACSALSVIGNFNTVSAGLAPAAEVDVQGDSNHVRYRLIGGTRKAKLTITGTDDVVGPDAAPLAGVAAPASRAPLTLADGGGERDCTDRDVSVTGDGLTATLQGGCRSLTVTGSGDSVHAEMQPDGRISVTGHGDQVFWFLGHGGAPPQIADVSSDSKVLQEQRLGSVIAAPDGAADDAAQPLVLTAGTGPAEQDCHGRDAQISGDHGTFVLRGRCRSITVTGSGDRVEAEMLAGSRIRIVGDDSVVQFALVDVGPDPIVSVAGAGSKAWRVQRLGAGSRAAASIGVTPTAGGMHVEGGRGASVTQMPSVPQPKDN